MKKIIVDIRGLEYTRYGQKIIKNLSLAICEGEFVVLVGPNGSGKSTLVKILNGSSKPSDGQVIVDGHNIAALPVHKVAHFVATLTQDLHHSTFSELSVLMNIELAFSRSVRKKQSTAEIKAYLASFNPSLADRLHVLAGHLSGGQRQALALAMCFAHTPKVVLLDEHTSALDPKAANGLMNLTNLHVREKKLTTIMVTHSLEHAMIYGDRLIAMGEGKVIADISGQAKAVLSKDDLINLAY